MSFFGFSGSRRAVALVAFAAGLSATLAAAQAPTLSVSQNNVVPGASVTLTVVGTAGEEYAIIGSVVDAGGSYGGQALAVGADYVVVAHGVLDASGRAVVPFTPPFLGSVIDRAYIQAATSASPTFMPLALSAGQVLRNNDLVSGLVGAAGVAGPAGPEGPMGGLGLTGATGPPGTDGTTGSAGPTGPTGLSGLAGVAGPIGPMGIMGSTGFTGPTGLTGLTGLPGVGFRTDCGGSNVAVWSSNAGEWVCSSALTTLTTAVEALTLRVAALESPVDQYLNTLTLSSAFPIGTTLPMMDNNGGDACHFSTGSQQLYVFGSDHQGYLGGRVVAFDNMTMGYFNTAGSIPVTTAQVLARCATGVAYTIVH